MPDQRLLRGTVAASPNAYALIAAQVPGRIMSVRVREGDGVKAGQLVAVIEARSYRDGLAQASAQLAQAQALVKHDATLVTRETRLFERGISARQQLEAASAAAEHDQAGAELARAALDTAELNLERANVRSPISGVVLRVLKHAGELADGTPTSALLEVADPQRLELAASAAPADLVMLRVGQKALARFESLPGNTFPLTVSAVAPSVDATTGVGLVRLAFSSGGLRPPFGLFGDALVSVGERANALTVPQAALRNPAGDSAEVMVCDGAVAKVRSVKVGWRDKSQVEIDGGLRPGERVAIDQVLGLDDGAEIEVLP